MAPDAQAVKSIPIVINVPIKVYHGQAIPSTLSVGTRWTTIFTWLIATMPARLPVWKLSMRP